MFHVVSMCVAECKHGLPLCPYCTGRSSLADVINKCQKQQCKNRLVRWVTHSFQ